KDNTLIPTFTAFAVTELLERHFQTLVDTRFTARMEEQLDEIAEGDAAWLPYLREFFSGPDGLEEKVRAGQESIDPREASTVRLQDLEARVRIGKFGAFIEAGDGEKPVTATLPEGLAPADLSEAQVQSLVRAKAEGPDSLGAHPESGEPIYVMNGRFGPYVQLGQATDENPKPKRASLPKGVGPDKATLELAVRLLALPRTLGTHPETGKEVQANVGRYGPYVVHEGEFRSIPKGEDVYTIGLERALEILAQPKAGRRTAAAPLRELGPHPEDGEPVVIMEGRYGPYVKHGSTNASLPKGVEVDEVVMEQAVELLRERAASAKKPARGARTAAAKKSTARKSTTKKSAVAKSAAKKTAAKKTTRRPKKQS
ncbi:MAG TPA: topoisomerase C-terminal repeat-containing protein, partial [Longimicrobiaceae bacterium]|nr:topoisomerase C-terminal repeat-containing protein [Longimicrobiaceae bacterium]